PPVHPPERRRGRRPGGCRAGDGALAPRVTAAHGLLPGWFVLTLLAALRANGLANSMTRGTIGLMRRPSPFPQPVREIELVLLPRVQVLEYDTPATAHIAYLWQIEAQFRDDETPTPSLLLRVRVITAQVVLGAVASVGWIVGPIFFPAATLLRFGRWTPDLAS